MDSISLSDHFDYKKLIKFTSPTIFMMIFTSIYGVIDGLFVSNIVGSEAFTAVNLTYPVIMILSSIGFMVGNGGSALVSRTLGEGKPDLARKYFSMLIYFLIICGIILSLLGFFFIDDIMILLKASGDLLNYCILYGRILFISLPFFMLQDAFQSFFIVNERPKLGLGVAILAGITNIVLDFLLIYIFKLGLMGAALATLFSQIIGAIIPIIFFIFSKESTLKLIKTKINKKPIIKSCINGSSEMFTNVSMSLVNMLYNYQLISFFGNNGVAAYGIIMYVGFIFTGVYLGYSFGMTPIIGFNYGAQNHKELKNVLYTSIKILACVSIVLTLLAELFSGYLAKIFVSYDADLLQLTTKAIRLYSIAYLIQRVNIFLSAFFTALSNGLISALISFSRTLVFQAAMILILPVFFGNNGIRVAIVGAELLALIVSGTCFIKNKKKYQYS